MDENINNHPTFSSWIGDWRDKKSLPYKIITLAGVTWTVYAAFGKSIAKVNVMNLSEGVFAIITIALNIIAIGCGLAITVGDYSVDDKQTLEKLKAVAPEMSGNSGEYSASHFLNDQEHAAKFLKKFCLFFQSFLIFSFCLYILLGVDTWMKTTMPTQHRFNYDKSAQYDSLIHDRLLHQTNNLLSFDTIKKRPDVLYDGTTKNLFDNSVTSVQNIYWYTYNNNLAKDILEIVLSFFNNMSICFLYGCCLLFYRISDEEQRKKDVRPAIVLVIIVLCTAAQFFVRSFAEELSIQNFVKIHWGFRLVSGLLNAVIFSLFLSKFNSRFFRPEWYILLVFSTYSAIQVLFPMFDYSPAGHRFAIMDITTTICFLAKSLCFLYIYWLLKSNRMYFYFLTYGMTVRLIDNNWDRLMPVIVNTRKMRKKIPKIEQS